MKKSFTYDLLEPIKITQNGQLIEAHSLEIFAPRNQVFADNNIIDVEFNRAKNQAIKESNEFLKGFNPEQLQVIKSLGDKEEKKEEVSSQQIILEMIRNGADLNKCTLALKNILSAGNKERPMCLIDNTKMIKEHFDDLSIQDTKNILGEYIKNFSDAYQNTTQKS